MATPQAAVAMAAQALFTTIALFTLNSRCLLWVVSSLIAMAGAIIVHVADPTTQRNLSLAGVYIMGSCNAPWVLALSLQTSNTGGTTKKSFVSVSVAIFYGESDIETPHCRFIHICCLLT
jgi:4-amino-4-deoxy-L-arabinose transferase-like glycosyltransferase